jgi:hypothetical protein
MAYITHMISIHVSFAKYILSYPQSTGCLPIGRWLVFMDAIFIFGKDNLCALANLHHIQLKLVLYRAYPLAHRTSPKISKT